MALNPPAVVLPSNTYTKVYNSPRQIISHLKLCGLSVPNEQIAEHQINLIGYETFRIYFLSRRQVKVPGKPFEPGIVFDDIVMLYNLDVELRKICFEPCGVFEVLLRNTTADIVGAAYGSHPYENPDVFKAPASHLDALRMFAEAYSKSKDQRAKHYRMHYKGPVLPPIWLMKDLLMFGNVMSFWRSMNSSIRSAVSQKFGVHDPEVFDSWIDCMVDLRNICAHHGRLFNRSFQKQPARLIRANVPTALAREETKKLKAVLECLDHLISSRGQNSGLVSSANALISGCSAARPADSGF